MKNKIFLVCVGLIILLGIGISVTTKASFNSNNLSDISEYSDFTLNYIDMEDSGLVNPYFNNDINSIEELQSKSELIVKISDIVKREHVSRATLTTVKVDAVLKGNLAANEILIYEPSYFWEYTNSSGNFSTEGYQLMKDGNQYILFLQNLKAPKEYELSDNKSNTYLPLSLFYSKFPINESDWIPQKLKTDTIKFLDIEDFEILTYKDEVLEKYLDLKKEVIKKY